MVKCHINRVDSNEYIGIFTSQVDRHYRLDDIIPINLVNATYLLVGSTYRAQGTPLLEQHIVDVERSGGEIAGGSAFLGVLRTYVVVPHCRATSYELRLSQG